jgi:quercetin dioxygenase-like cupin family protein
VHEVAGIARRYRDQSQPAFPFAARATDTPGVITLNIRHPEANGVTRMSYRNHVRRRIIVAAAIAGASLIPLPVLAGECPADQKKPDARAAVDLKPVGVTDTVIASIDVDKAPVNIDGRKFRMRQLTIEPGGVVPWHSHADRPAIIYIVQGEIQEYASNCVAPIVHEAGDVVAETSEVSHWWKNLGDKAVVLLSADLLRDEKDHNM